MLSILKNELEDFPKHRELKTNINEIYRELKRQTYERVIQLCQESVQLCDNIKMQAIVSQNELIANSLFVVKAYCEMFKYYSMYWQLLLEERYKDSWILLQDTIDKLFVVTKFTKNHNEFGIELLNEHLNQLEKLYPYKIFASIEAVVKTKKCSICGKSLLDLDCSHIPGELYWGEMAVSKAEGIVLEAVALVQHPLDKRCVMELSEDTRTEKEKFKILNYFVENNKNPLCFFSVIETENFFYNEDYDIAGRNDPCPCNSGKKFKKCCGEYKYQKGVYSHIEVKGEISFKPLLTAKC